MAISTSTKTNGLDNGKEKSSIDFSQFWDRFGMLAVFAILFILCALFVPNFASFISYNFV